MSDVIENGIGKSLRRVDNDTYRMAVDIEDATGVSVNVDVGMTDDAAFTAGTSEVVPMGAVADETSTDSVDEGDVGGVRMTLNRRLITSSETADDAAPETGTKPSVVGGVFDDTTPDSVDEGDAGYLRMSARREAYVQIRDAAGNERGLNIDASNNLGAKLAANSGVDIGDVDVTSVIPGTGATNLGKAEDAAHASGDTGVMALGVRQAANGPVSGADGDYEPLQTDANGHLKVNIIDALPAGSAAIGKLAANSGVDIGDVDILSIAAGDNNIGNVDIQLAGTAVTGGAGAVAAGTPRMTLASDDPAVASLSVMDDWDNAASDGASVSGDVAHDAVDAGEPVKVGYKGYAFDGTAPQTAVAEADRVNAISDLQGIQYVQTAHPFFWSVSADYGAAQTNATVKAAPGASLSLYLTDIIISNGATAGNVTLLDGSGGTVLFEVYPGINGGVAHSFKNPIKLTANTLLAITSTTVTTHSVNVSGFIAA